MLDLLAPEDITALLAEAYRVLKPDGLICLVSLTHGNSIFSRLVESVWTSLYGLKPALVGGCRPIRLGEYISQSNWGIEFLQQVNSYGICSEILVAKKT